MFDTNDARRAHAAGKEVMFNEVMQSLATLEAKYKGVRGELLKKVKAELMNIKPPVTTFGPSSAERAPQKVAQQCRACGRELKRNGTDGALMCMNGHRA